jgi:hypothetical protein
LGASGFLPLAALGSFVFAVLVALALQTAYYLTRDRLGSWVRPFRLLGGIRDALVIAFSTASSTVTMPVTYERLLSMRALCSRRRIACERPELEGKSMARGYHRRDRLETARRQNADAGGHVA